MSIQKPPTQYELVFTDLAKAFARPSIAAVEERARGEIAELLTDGLENVGRLILHVFQMPDGREFICQGGGQDRVVIDTLSWQDHEPSSDAFNEGRIVRFPVADSDE